MAGKPVPIQLPDWLPPEEWKAFCDHMRELKIPPSEDRQRLWLAGLTQFRGQGGGPVAMLHQSIKRGWRGVFRIKSSPNGHREVLGERLPGHCVDCSKETYAAINGRCFGCYVSSKRRKAQEEPHARA